MILALCFGAVAGDGGGQGRGVGQLAAPAPGHVQVGPDEDQAVVLVNRPGGRRSHLERGERGADPGEGGGEFAGGRAVRGPGGQQEREAPP